MMCEYGRCGGTGRRETARRWVARFTLTIGARTWRVCEGCADLLLNSSREAGVRVSRKPIETAVPIHKAIGG